MCVVRLASGLNRAWTVSSRLRGEPRKTKLTVYRCDFYFMLVLVSARLDVGLLSFAIRQSKPTKRCFTTDELARYTLTGRTDTLPARHQLNVAVILLTPNLERKRSFACCCRYGFYFIFVTKSVVLLFFPSCL